MPTMTGGEAVVKMLQLHGVEYAFGMGGFQPLPYYDALARQDRVRHVLIRDEKDGAFAADAYTRVKNRPAVADATLGPGATNLVSGAAEAFGASTPLILLTGEVNSLISGRAATQESDQLGMLKPTCKMSIRLDRIERVPELVRRAFAVANGGRPGPVHLNVPEDVFHGRYDFPQAELYADPDACTPTARRARPDARLVERAAGLVRQAERPVLLVGGGVHLSQAYAELAEFVDATGIPTAYTISGKGSISDLHPLAIGLFGRFSRFANELIKQADVLLVVGCKLGEIATSRWSLLQPTSKIVQVDVDPTELGKVYRTEVGVWGDAKLALADLLAALWDEQPRMAARKARQRAEVEAARAAWRATAEPKLRSDEVPIHMARVLREVREALPPESIIVADGGFAAHWSALLYDVTATGRTYVANRGHAAIGYGLPGAIGAKLAAPDVPVVALCGDNGFAMAVAELETARRAGAPVIALVMDNAALGYVKALQHSLYRDRFISVDFLDVDYGQVARAFGCYGRRVATPGELQGALAEALESGVPAVVDILITTNPAEMLPSVDARTAQPAGARS